MSERLRFDGIDFWRGIVLCTIFIDHLPGNIFENFTPRNFGFSDAAEAFVFLSGVSLALAYGTHFEPSERVRTLRALARRSLKLYGVHIGLSLAAIAIFVIGADWGNRPDLLMAHGRDVVLKEPVVGTLGLFLLGHQLGYFNILPLYLVLIACVPLMLWLAMIDRRLMLACSAALYAATRLWGLDLPSWPDHGIWFFNPLAWQFLMAIGIAVGLGLRKGESIPTTRPLMWTAGVIVAVAAFVVTNGFGISHGVREAVQGSLDLTKTEFGLGRLVHFLALAYLVFGLRWTQSLREFPAYRPLALLGRHSLWVFAILSLLTAVGQVLMEAFQHAAWFDVLFVAGGLAVIYVATRLIDTKPARRPAPALLEPRLRA